MRRLYSLPTSINVWISRLTSRVACKETTLVAGVEANEVSTSNPLAVGAQGLHVSTWPEPFMHDVCPPSSIAALQQKFR